MDVGYYINRINKIEKIRDRLHEAAILKDDDGKIKIDIGDANEFAVMLCDEISRIKSMEVKDEQN